MRTSTDGARDGFRPLRRPALVVSGALMLGLLSNVLPSAVQAVGPSFWWYQVPISLVRSISMLVAADLILAFCVLETGGVGVGRLARVHLAVGTGLVVLAVGHAIVLPGLAAKLPNPTFETFFWGGSGRSLLVLTSLGLVAVITGLRMRTEAGRRLPTGFGA